MRHYVRAALAAASFFCLLGTATIAGPTFAAESDAPQGNATAMLAAVTAPLVSVDTRTLEARHPDFSTSGTTDGSTAPTVSSVQNATIETPRATDTAAQTPQSLDDLVANRVASTTGDEQGDCLATSVYYESKGEPLDGQLAVAQTIMNRTQSGRFPSSVCGVVRQPGQFSFIHNGSMPTPPRESSAWKRAVAVAMIARDNAWKQIAPAALFFHAKRVSPGWGKIKVASLGNHIFFR